MAPQSRDHPRLDTQAFEGFFLILFSDFEKMADKFVDLNGDMSREDIIALLKHRLQPVH